MDKGKGFVLWFTGLPCSGKTSLSTYLVGKFRDLGVKIEQLDGDIVRESLCADLGFSKEDRNKNIDRIIFVSKLLSRQDVGVLVTFISPYKEKREEARDQVTRYIEVFVDCPVSECEKRDVKGMYKLAREGKIKDFTGISAPYEKPEHPDITVKTDEETLEQSAAKILSYVQRYYAI